MKKVSWKKLIWVVVLVCVFIVLFKDCYNIETSNVKRYKSFYNKMEKEIPYVHEVLPNPQDLQLEEVYLYHWDMDLLDTTYVVYLNCIYDDHKEYEAEKMRQRKLGRQWPATKFDSASFDYESVVSGEPSGVDIYYDYVLFIDDECRIVHVHMFDMKDKHKNIPYKYLPKELR